ncbi:MAG: MFS transporter [Bradyrhizobium sp.]
MGPSLGAWLTETYSWHWVFFVNLPFGIVTVLGLLVFMDETKQDANLRFDWFGFAALAIGIGSMQVALDRGEQLGWLESNEIIGEIIVSIIGFYYFFAHSLTTAKPFIQFAIFKDRNFVSGCVFMAVMGLVLFSTMALSSPYLQNVIGYPIITAGLLLATRGCGTFVAMMLVGRFMKYIEARTLIISGLALMSLSLFFMTGWTDQTNVPTIIVVSIAQGFGLGLVFVPLSTVAFLSLPNHLRTDGTAMLTLMRNVASSIGISVVIALTDRGRTPRLRNFVGAHQPVQSGAADAGCARHDRSEFRRRPRVGGCGGRHPGADHRVRAGLSDGHDHYAVCDPADHHDRLQQGRTAQAVGGAGTRGAGIRIVGLRNGLPSPLPLWERSDCIADAIRVRGYGLSIDCTPLPNPPPQGGRELTSVAATD